MYVPWVFFSEILSPFLYSNSLHSEETSVILLSKLTCI